jgi:thiamine-monophosphate kinase
VPAEEATIIERIRRRAKTKSQTLRIGIGDDCAVLRPRRGEELVVTTDLSVEGTHFRRDWHPPQSVGHRCLTRGLSDVAAMGARPIAAFLSLTLPGDLPQQWVDEFLDAFFALADRYQCPLAGGDISQSLIGVVADIMVIGSVPRGKALLRSGARPGDVVYVTGTLGDSAATLSKLQKQKVPLFRLANPRLKPWTTQTAEERQLFPEPRIAIGEFLRKKSIARAMIDISDGLSTDLGHICDESGVGAMINSNLIPVSTGANLELALHGGEDYELLFTASPRAKVPVEFGGVAITEIGWITRERGVYITDVRSKPQRLDPRGWEHFRRNP